VSAASLLRASLSGWRCTASTTRVAAGAGVALREGGAQVGEWCILPLPAPESGQRLAGDVLCEELTQGTTPMRPLLLGLSIRSLLSIAGATLALQQPNPFASQATPLWQAIVAQLLLESALRPLCGRYRSAGDHGSAPPMGLVRGHAATRACADLRTR